MDAMRKRVCFVGYDEDDNHNDDTDEGEDIN